MGQREDTEEERSSWHWRNSMRPVRFFALDVRCAIPWCILFFHISKATITIAVLVTIVFYMMETRGLTFDASLRTFRTWFLGQRRYALLPISRKHMVDFG